MILSTLEKAHRYKAVNKGFEKAFEFLLRPDLHELPVGKYEIDGKSVFAEVAKGPGRRKDGTPLETHEKYIDIQCVLAGTDHMGWKPKALCKNPSMEYDEERDLQFFTDVPDVWISTESGCLAIFFPEDAHVPMISSGQIHKVVVKVAVDQEC